VLRHLRPVAFSQAKWRKQCFQKQQCEQKPLSEGAETCASPAMLGCGVGKKVRVFYCRMTNDHKLSGLKQNPFASSQCCRLDTEGPGCLLRMKSGW